MQKTRYLFVQLDDIIVTLNFGRNLNPDEEAGDVSSFLQIFPPAQQIGKDVRQYFFVARNDRLSESTPVSGKRDEEVRLDIRGDRILTYDPISGGG